MLKRRQGPQKGQGRVSPLIMSQSLRHQLSPNDDWGVDMDECLGVFNMDVGEEFGIDENNDQVGDSSTFPKKSQTYVLLGRKPFLLLRQSP